jgi:hypothetical protein
MENTNEFDNYSESDLARMRYYYKELESLLVKHPGSLTIRNGLARLDVILGHKVKYLPVDFSEELDRKIEEEKNKILLDKTLGI